MFQRFTKTAIATVLRAQAETERFNHYWTGSEHILLALIGIDGPVASLLNEGGLTLTQIRSDVVEFYGERLPPPEAEVSWWRNILDKFFLPEKNCRPFSPSARQLFEFAFENSFETQCNVDERHLCLSILRQQDSFASQLVRKYVPDTTTLRDALLSLDLK